MMQVLLVIHLIVTVVMIGLILLQRSEGGGLGIGGGSGGLGAFAGPRATANMLTKATMTCFALFVGLSLLIGILAGGAHAQKGLIDQLAETPAAATVPAKTAEVPAAKTATDAPVNPKNEPEKPVKKQQVPIGN